MKEGRVESVSTSQDERGSDEMELITFLCHEVGNQLAAAHLSGHVLRLDQTPAQAAKIGAAIEGLATQSGALVALVGPLLGASKTYAETLAPESLLEALPNALPDEAVTRVRFRRLASDPLPAISANSHMLTSLLLALVLGACEGSPESSPVRLGLRCAKEGVELSIESQVPLDSEAELAAAGGAAPVGGLALRGNPLLYAIARALLLPIGGGLTLEAGSEGFDNGSCLRLILPLDLPLG